MSKIQKILKEFPLIVECLFELDCEPKESKLSIDNNNNKTLNLLQGHYLELSSGKQASFLDDKEREEYEHSYEIKKYCPNSTLIAVSSVAILFHEKFGFYSKGWGDLDESDADFLGLNLAKILKNEMLIDKLFDY